MRENPVAPSAGEEEAKLGKVVSITIASLPANEAEALRAGSWSPALSALLLSLMVPPFSASAPVEA